MWTPESDTIKIYALYFSYMLIHIYITQYTYRHLTQAQTYLAGPGLGKYKILNQECVNIGRY